MRIIPAQHLSRQKISGRRYGFIIRNHPLGVTETGAGFTKGDYVASWETREEAEAALHCLGQTGEFQYSNVYSMPVLIPDREF